MVIDYSKVDFETEVIVLRRHRTHASSVK